MRKSIIFLMVMVLGGVSVSVPASYANSERDRYVFERLLDERAEVYRQYTNALARGKKEYKKTGDVKLDTRNDILTLRSRKDSIETRLITVAFRHGWEVPELDEKTKSMDLKAKELERVFGVAKILVQGELRKDVNLFTSGMDLPVQKVNLK